MITETGNGASGDVLLQMRGLKIEGQADDQWHEIVPKYRNLFNREPMQIGKLSMPNKAKINGEYAV